MLINSVFNLLPVNLVRLSSIFSVVFVCLRKEVTHLVIDAGARHAMPSEGVQRPLQKLGERPQTEQIGGIMLVLYKQLQGLLVHGPKHKDF
jgi:hypothetical protein